MFALIFGLVMGAVINVHQCINVQSSGHYYLGSKEICESMRLVEKYDMLNIMAIGMVANDSGSNLLIVTKDLYAFEVEMKSLHSNEMLLDLSDQKAFRIGDRFSKLTLKKQFQMIYEYDKIYCSFIHTVVPAFKPDSLNDTEPSPSQDLRRISRIYFLSISETTIMYPVNGEIIDDDTNESGPENIPFNIPLRENFEQFHLSNAIDGVDGGWKLFVWRNHYENDSMKTNNSIGISGLFRFGASNEPRYSFSFICTDGQTVFLKPVNKGECEHGKAFHSNPEIGFFTDKHLYMISKQYVYQFPREMFLENATKHYHFKMVNLEDFFRCPVNDEKVDVVLPEAIHLLNRKRNSLLICIVLVSAAMLIDLFVFFYIWKRIIPRIQRNKRLEDARQGKQPIGSSISAIGSSVIGSKSAMPAASKHKSAKREKQSTKQTVGSTKSTRTSLKSPKTMQTTTTASTTGKKSPSNLKSTKSIPSIAGRSLKQVKSSKLQSEAGSNLETAVSKSQVSSVMDNSNVSETGSSAS